MAQFRYEVMTSGGRLLKGSMEAKSKDEARSVLEKMEVEIKLLEKDTQKISVTSLDKDEFMLFNQQLALITQAGLPIGKAFRKMGNDFGSKRLKKLVSEIADELEEGASVQESFAKRQSFFHPMYGKIIEAGIKTGRLGKMLLNLHRHLETTARTGRILFEATFYPVLILLLSMALITVGIIWVAPQFAETYSEVGSNDMFQISFFVFLSEKMIPFWIGTLIAICAVIIIMFVWGKVGSVRRFKELIYLNFPVVGRVYRSSLLSRLADSMSMLVDAGCDLPTCLSLGSAVTGSELVKEECDRLVKEVESGSELSIDNSYSLLPNMFIYSMRLGSQRNELYGHLRGLVDMYSNQTLVYQGRLQAALMPLLLILVGVIAGFFIIAGFIPYIELLDTISQHP